MHERNRNRHIEFSAKDLLPDALMSTVFLIMCIGVCSLFLVPSDDSLSLYFACWLLAIPAAFLFFVRRLSLPAIPMILLHIGAVLLPVLLFVSMGLEVLLVTACAGISLVIYSLSAKFRANPVSASSVLIFVSLIFHLFILLITFLRKADKLTPYIVSGFLISLCFFLAVRQIFAFQKGFDHFLTSPTQPGKLILSNNNKVIIILFAASLFILPVSIIIPYGSIIDFFKFIIKYIVIFILFFISLIPEPAEVAEESTPADLTGSEEYGHASSGILAQILEIIIFAAVIIFVLYGLYKFISAAASYIRTHYRRSMSQVTPAVSLYVTDEIIELKKAANRNKRKLPAFGTGEERKIRKQYYHTVKEAISKGSKIKGSSTAEEIRTAVFDANGKDITDLTRRYEEVRYGQNSDLIINR